MSHSITPRDILEVSPVKIAGATAFETSGKYGLFSERGLLFREAARVLGFRNVNCVQVQLKQATHRLIYM